jgi:hypothetical protein
MGLPESLAPHQEVARPRGNRQPLPSDPSNLRHNARDHSPFLLMQYDIGAVVHINTGDKQENTGQGTINRAWRACRTGRNRGVLGP